VCDGYTTAGVSLVGSQKARRLGQTVRGLAVACAIDITTSTFPVSVEFCSIGYDEIKVRPGVPIKTWGGSNPDIQVTLVKVRRHPSAGNLRRHASAPDG